MAWHLSEFLTEARVLPGAMYRLEKNYIGEKLDPNSRAWRSFYRYLRQSHVNLSLIEEKYPLRGEATCSPSSRQTWDCSFVTSAL